MAQLGELETKVSGLQHDVLVTAAWIEFRERGKRLDRRTPAGDDGKARM